MHIGLEEFKALLLLWIALMLMFHSINNKYSVMIASAIVLVITLVTNIYMYNTFNTNIDLFKSNKKLECRSSNLKHLVKKTNGWKQEQSYFIKDDLMIKIDDCEEF